MKFFRYPRIDVKLTGYAAMAPLNQYNVEKEKIYADFRRKLFNRTPTRPRRMDDDKDMYKDKGTQHLSTKIALSTATNSSDQLIEDEEGEQQDRVGKMDIEPVTFHRREDAAEAELDLMSRPHQPMRRHLRLHRSPPLNNKKINSNSVDVDHHHHQQIHRYNHHHNYPNHQHQHQHHHDQRHRHRNENYRHYRQHLQHKTQSLELRDLEKEEKEEARKDKSFPLISKEMLA